MAHPFDTTHWSVVLGAAEQNPARRQAFGKQYLPIVRAYLAARWRLPADHERVEDAVQDVFVQCFRPGGALKHVDPIRPGGFRSFLFGVVRHVAIDAERQRYRLSGLAPNGGDNLDATEANEDLPSQVFDREWARMVAEQAFELMSARGGGVAQRRIAVLRLRYYDGIPPREIAANARMDVRDVYRLLEAGRNQFRATMLEVMAKHHSGESRSELERRCCELIALF